jgi:glycosyltransferase 2 family protein
MLTRAIIFLVGAFCTVFFLKALLDVIGDVENAALVPDISALAVSLAINAAWIVGLEFLWEWSLRRVYGQNALPWKRSAYVFMKSYLARYAPGKIWPIAVRVSTLKDVGINWSRIVAASLFEQLSLVLGTLFSTLWLTVFLVSATRYQIERSLIWTVVALSLLAVLVFGIPRRLRLYLTYQSRNYLRNRFGDEAGSLSLPHSGTWLAGSFFGATLSCAQALIALPLLSPLLQGQYSNLAILSIAMAYPTARVVGQFASIMPAGLAVREGVFILLLAPILAHEAAVGIAIWLRVLSCCAELLLFAITALWNSRLPLLARKA